MSGGNCMSGSSANLPDFLNPNSALEAFPAEGTRHHRRLRHGRDRRDFPPHRFDGGDRSGKSRFFDHNRAPFVEVKLDYGSDKEVSASVLTDFQWRVSAGFLELDRVADHAIPFLVSCLMGFQMRDIAAGLDGLLNRLRQLLERHRSRAISQSPFHEHVRPRCGRARRFQLPPPL